MNSILLYFLLTASPLGDSIQEPPTDVIRYYNDSLRLYNVYAYQTTYLRSIKETDTAEWNRKARHDHVITCAILKNISKYNNKPYEPIDSFKISGCETAYKYPKPSGNKLHHVVYDKQTRFTTKDNGGTHKPYITKTVFDPDTGAVISEDKLDPITLVKIID